MGFHSHKRTVAVVIAALLLSAGPASAQNTQGQPTSGGVAHQFKSGAHRVGEGATKIGHGIKQGAILTWHSVKHAAQAAGARLDGHHTVEHKHVIAPRSSSN
jgi:hypothetical protein